MRWAVYDLRIGPPSFDFLTFLVMARYHGATHVWLVPGWNEAKKTQYEEKEQQARVRSIVLPACELYGMPYKIEPVAGKSKRDFDIAWPPYSRSSQKALSAGYMVGWLRSIKAPDPIMPSAEALNRAADRLQGKEIVVHLRRTAYQQARNSGHDWERWAADHNAYVLPDEPISLDERVAVHELAKLNIGVGSGPMSISEYSIHRPYITLKRLAGEVSTNEEFFAWQGWYPGDKYPWATKHQMVVWDDRDDYDAIEVAYTRWLELSGLEDPVCLVR